jgi:hypothetical protein
MTRQSEATMHRLAIRSAAGLAAALAGVMLGGATPPLPVTPHPPVEPFLLRIITSGAPPLGGEMESCVDPQAMMASARERVKARPADAPPPLTGCTRSHDIRPGAHGDALRPRSRRADELLDDDGRDA